MRDPNDVVIRQSYAQQFEALAAQLGAASPDNLSDAEYHAVANECWRINSPGLHYQALVDGGLTIDASVAPEWGQRLAATGAGPQDVQRFASGLYPDLDPVAAVRRYQRDVMRASGSTVAEPREPNYGSPF